jgi:hypothetical protein
MCRFLLATSVAVLLAAAPAVAHAPGEVNYFMQTTSAARARHATSAPPRMRSPGSNQRRVLT